VPIPRRFDRRPPERDQTRINERIRVPEVRLIGEDGNQVGVLSRDDALAYARQRDLDLVEVAADARPPVCRVLDYSKYKYEQEQKAKQARKHQKQVTVREIKLRPKIATNDYETKKNHVERFLKHQDRVKITIMFRGRETTHPERGERLLMQLAEDVSEFGTIEQRPNLDGRNMTMLLAPVRQKEAADEQPAAGREAAPADAAGEAAPADTAGEAAPASAPADAAAAPGDAPVAVPADSGAETASTDAPAAAATPPDDAGATPATAPPEAATPPAAAADDAA
jgi:translation initiation factor IF-3